MSVDAAGLARILPAAHVKIVYFAASVPSQVEEFVHAVHLPSANNLNPSKHVLHFPVPSPSSHPSKASQTFVYVLKP